MSQSIDGHPLAGIERSSHLEEYSRTRPASAGSRPRSLLNKVANAAAAAQVDDDPDPADAEPWVLEGWGDGPSVSEAAQQAALKLAPYLKNVPTTLVGLGGGPGGGRRVLSAGPGGRGSQLKASEARRKPPGGASPLPQGDRRALGSQNPMPAGVVPGGPHTTATVRRAAMPPLRNLDVGDESDVEPSVPSSSGTTGARTAGGGITLAPSRSVVGAGPKPSGPTAGSARQIQSSVASQIVQNTPGVATKLAGRRDVAGAVSTQQLGPSPAAALGAAAAAATTGSGSASPISPRYRSLSAEAHHHPSPMGPGSAAAGSSGIPGRAGMHGAAAAARGSPGPGSATHHGHLLLPPYGHLEPLSPLQGKYGSRGDPGPNSSGTTTAGGGTSAKLPRSSSFTSSGKPPAFGASSAASNDPDDVIANLAPMAPPPQLPGLFLTGRKGASFRNDALGLSGWDPEAPAVQHPGSPLTAGASSSGGGATAQNVSLWIGPTAPGAGTSGLQVGSPAGSGRGSPAGGQGARREQLAGNSRLHRGATTGPGAQAPASTPLAPLDLGLAPERSSGGGTGAGPRARMPATGCSPSPDVTAGFGYHMPQQDALSDFAASRQDISSAGSIGGAAGAELQKRAPSRTGTYTGLLPPTSAAMPMRVTSLGMKSPPAPRP
ncbi:hypothetical protein HYH02_006953 [Chlamydomonas schloesseri]|uniref:Uncharacterized protein n=1 Tax=Chlamydomonas schloesseri TaxID=2026947 RepID=A0A836B5M7_9CHLO|nr:hypothetical protein HYH02_006953 [Chlamydomonas schloesseri]|eukprot:KAG2448371.1 hypothetical protein HYH02_006953 [Chlamydomonas schloesseri]